MKKTIAICILLALGLFAAGGIYDAILTGKLGQIVIDGPPGYNTYTGIVRRVIPLKDVDRGDLVYISTSTGLGYPRVGKADADAANTVGDILIMVEAANSGGVALALDNGVISNSAWDFASAGVLVYVSTTSGLITSTAPSGSGDQVQIVGVTEASDIVRFKPSLNIATAE